MSAQAWWYDDPADLDQEGRDVVTAANVVVCPRCGLPLTKGPRADELPNDSPGPDSITSARYCASRCTEISPSTEQVAFA